MPARRILPDKPTLARWLAEGLTHQQMADRVYAETGERVTRSAISVACSRYGLADQAPRYKDELPWRVQVRHLRAYPARMLRLLGRRRAGGTLGEEESARLDAWLELLDRENAVVAYDPDSDEGFVYVDREAGDPGDIPIRRNRVWLNGS